jgi:hypothetical protein
LEDDKLRVSVTQQGGHIAEILHNASAVSPLWVPPWPSIEPSTYSLTKHPEYGADAESKLLSGIMGHNLALDLFGGPSPEEAAAGMTVHGEASVLPYEILLTERHLTAVCSLSAAQLKLERHIRLDGPRVLITETVENVAILDQPVAWTQHVTLGPPFLEKGSTQFRAPGTKGRTLSNSKDFDWPRTSRNQDLQLYTNEPASGGFDTVLMDPHRDRAFFFAFSPKTKVLFGYVWIRSDFPWLGIWEENYNRKQPPWNGKTLTRGMEFGASPIPESRRKMIERNSLFGMPCYRWIPAKTKVTVDYFAFITTADSIPNSLEELQVHISA